jgi:thiol-disulfide isomerase/thioredoxin
MLFFRFFHKVAVFIFLPCLVSAQGHEIRMKIHELQDTSIIIGHYLNKSMYPDDTLKLDSKGTGVFTGPGKYPQGLYLIYLPSSRYFEIILGDDQQFSIESDTTDFVNSIVFKGSEENRIFYDFQHYMIALRKSADSLTALIKKEKNQSSREKYALELKTINENRISRINQIIVQYPGFFVSEFLKATLEVKVPDPPKDEHGNIIDSTWQYFYYKHHYFDNFNIADPRLLRTPLYEDKIMTYLTKVCPQIPDSLIKEVDYLIEKSKSDSTLFRYILITLFNYYGKSNIMGMDAVQVHIADKYYLNSSWWSDEKFLADLRERVEKTRPLLIGKTAPDIELMAIPAEHFIQAKADTALKRFPHVGTKINLLGINANYLVLLFWEADCGHCKKAVPELYRIYEKSLKNMNVKVLAISTLFGEDGKIKWVDFVNEHGLYNWINAWNPYSYEYKIKYDITSTPQIYILDEHKKIVAKKIGPEQVEEIIKSLARR